MKRFLLFLPLLLFALMVLLFKAMLGHDPSALDLARKGQPFPAFSLTELRDENRMVTHGDLRGQPMLVNVWATWCPACRTEHPELLRIAASEGIAVIGLNYKDDRKAAVAWLEKLGDPYRFTIFDPDGRLGLDLGVYGAPETYVVDADGVLLYRHVGVVDQQVWREKLQPLLAGLDGSSSGDRTASAGGMSPAPVTAGREQ